MYIVVGEQNSQDYGVVLMRSGGGGGEERRGGRKFYSHTYMYTPLPTHDGLATHTHDTHTHTHTHTHTP